MPQSLKVSIVGASGYSGAELLKILLRHTHARVEKLFANSSAGKRVADVYPAFAQRVDASYEPYTLDAACTSDAVFIALPSGEAMNIVPELLSRGKRIIDFGGDFRLRDATVYQQFYKHEHKAASLLSQAVYGLPELNREQITSAKLVANPGCYPTGAILPLIPILKEGLIEPKGIAVNSLSGVSGAGRSASTDLSFTEINESVKAYKVGVHQHIPEINQTLSDATEQSVSVTFVPHLLPITRGIYTSIYATLKRTVNEQDVLAAYNTYYAKEPFVRFSSTAIPEIKNVNHTNYIDIGFRVYAENNQLIVLSALDNLVKGAAGQAVQNMNLMFGFDETEGLL